MASARIGNTYVTGIKELNDLCAAILDAGGQIIYVVPGDVPPSLAASNDPSTANYIVGVYGTVE